MQSTIELNIPDEPIANDDNGKQPAQGTAKKPAQGTAKKRPALGSLNSNRSPLDIGPATIRKPAAVAAKPPPKTPSGSRVGGNTSFTNPFMATSFDSTFTAYDGDRMTASMPDPARLFATGGRSHSAPPHLHSAPRSHLAPTLPTNTIDLTNSPPVLSRVDQLYEQLLNYSLLKNGAEALLEEGDHAQFQVDDTNAGRRVQQLVDFPDKAKVLIS